MGQRSQGWTLRWRGKPGEEVGHVRFRHEGTRYEESTGTRDRGEVRARAAEIYADVVAGRRRKHSGRSVDVAREPLGELGIDWIESLENTHAPRTVRLYELHLTTHLIPFFRTLGGITTAKIADYGRDRLGLVLRSTVIKERNTLATFLAWCKERGLLDALPEWPKLPKRAPGTRAVKRLAEAVHVEPAQVAAFLSALPEWSPGKKGGSRRFAVRSYFAVSWETGLRPSTIAALEVPKHYRPGASELFIALDIDKGYFERTIPITEETTIALDAALDGRNKGLIFGAHDYRDFVTAAAKVASLPTGFYAYALKHSRGVQLVEATGNLPGVAFLFGHKKITTTARYVRPHRRAAFDVLGAVAGAKRGHKKAPAPPRERKGRSAKEGT